MFAVFAVGVGVAVAAVMEGGSGSAAYRSAPTAEVPQAAACSGDAGYLLATILAMPAAVSAQVVGNLSPALREGLGNAVQYMVGPEALPPPPDAVALGVVLARLDVTDTNAILGGLPVEQQQAVTAVQHSLPFALLSACG
ncbi:MAG TPA: hypothetical protein VHJ79_23055 [Mycobacterium sp.]|nr:hypothetical protein [Mycobacterium sp.]